MVTPSPDTITGSRTSASVSGDMQAIHSAESLGIESAPLEGCQHAVVGDLVTDEHTNLVALQARRQEVRRRLKLLLRLPEVGDVVPQRHERVPNAEGQAGLTGSAAGGSSAPEEPEQAPLVGDEIHRRLLPEPLERVHHEPHLGEVGFTARTDPAVRLEAVPVVRGQRSLQVRRHVFHKLLAWHVSI